jgi:VWFA-related protein
MHTMATGRLAAVTWTVAAVSAAATLTVAAQQQRFKAGVDLVHFSVIVTDKQGSPVTGLKAEDFELVEEGKPQSVVYFTEGDPNDGDKLGEVLPLRLGLALDSSGSMDRDIVDVRTGAIRFLTSNEAAIDYTLVDFDTEVRVTRYGPDETERLIERIRRRKPDGWTALYDAVGVYLNSIGPQDGQKILLLYTDGGDTRSELTFSDLLDLLKSSDVTVYSIGYLEHQPSGARTQ